MSEASESRQHGVYGAQRSKHLETARISYIYQKNVLPHNLSACEACICDIKHSLYNDVQRHQPGAVLVAQDSKEKARVDVSRSRYQLDRLETHHQHGDGSRKANLMQSKHYTCLLKNKYLKTDRQLQEITKGVAIKYVQKLKRFTLRNKKTDAIKLPSNISKQKKNLSVNRASTAFLFLSDGQSKFRSFASNSLSSDSSIRPNDKIPNTAYKSSHFDFPSTKLSSKLMLKTKLSFFFNSQIPDECQRKHCHPHACQSILLNLNFGCNSFSHVFQNKKKLVRQSSVLSTSTTTLSASTEVSSDKRTKFHTQVIRRSNEKKPALEYIYSMAKHNGGIIEFENKDTKIIAKHKLRRILFNKCQRFLMSKIDTHDFTQTYHTYFAELDYNNLALSRQAVGIGSTCEFSIDFGRSTIPDPNVNGEQYGQILGTEDQVNTAALLTTAKSKRSAKLKRSPFECSPGVCIPGKCEPIECYKRAPYGSHASTQSGKYQVQEPKAIKGKEFKRKSASVIRNDKNSLKKTDRQGLTRRGIPTQGLSHGSATRIGSNLNVNIEFYKDKRLNSQSVKRMSDYAGTDGTDSYGTSHSSQTSTKSRKKKQELKTETFYKEKGVASIPRPKQTLHIPNRQAVRIGSKCSFDVEFYKALPYTQTQTTFNLNPQPYNNDETLASQFTKLNAKNGRKRKPLDCQPGVCIPGKCSPIECYQRIKARQESTGTETSLSGTSNTASHGNQASNKALRGIRQPKIQLEDVNGPKNNVVRIGSNCKFNIEFYKSKPQRYGGQYNQGDAGPGVPIGKKSKLLKGFGRNIKQYVCEPGVCIPDKCDPNECFARLKTKHEGTRTDASLAASSKGSSYGSQATTQTKKRKTTDQRKIKGKESSFKDKAASTLPRSKMPLHVPNRQVVRIGSKCSFNIEFYKELSKNGLTDSNGKRIDTVSNFPGQYNKMGTALKPKECEPGVCVPGTCDPNECYQRLLGTKKQKTSGSTGPQTIETSDQSTTVSSINQQDKSKKTIGTEKKTKEMKGKNKNKTPGKYEHGDAAVQSKTSTESNRKKFEKISKQDQGDAAVTKKEETKQLICDIGVCIPDTCDPNECFERLKSKREGTSTEASLASGSASSGSDVATQSKIAGVNLGKQNKAGQKSRKGKEHLYVKEKGTSSITDSNKISKKDLELQPPPRDLPHDKQAVRIGSTFSFNITFFKEKPRTGSQINRELAIAPKSETQTTNKKGIAPLLKQCYCQMKLKSLKNKQTLMTYDQGSNTDGSMRVPLKNGNNIKPTMNGLECEPGMCVYGKCDPNECYQRLNTGTDTSPGAKSTANNGNSVATQSRRYSILEQLQPTVLRGGCKCKCGAKIIPFAQNKGFGGNNFGGLVHEKAVILGSGCNFNFKYFGKKNK